MSRGPIRPSTAAAVAAAESAAPPAGVGDRKAPPDRDLPGDAE